ncbi:MAG: hypothetical protein ABIX28_09660 [Vicinamibacterales bacterium]
MRLGTLTLLTALAWAPAAMAQTRPPTPVTPPAQTPARPPQTPPARPATRPAPPPKLVGFVTFGGGIQVASNEFSETHSEPLYGEQKTWTAGYQVEDALDFEVGGGSRVWRDLFVGATYSRVHDSAPASVSGQIPHPFFFNQPRTISGESADLSHDENGVHISVYWRVPVGRRLEVAVFGGPSIINVSRQLVKDVEFTEAYPYDTAEFSLATVEQASKTGIGVHGGASVSYFVTRQIGVGGLLRYSRASLDLPTPSSGSVSLDAGGLQAAATVTVRLFAKPAAPPVPARGTPARTPPGTASRTVVPDVPSGPIGTAIATGTTPIFLRADATLKPLRQVPAGTRLRILDQTAEWVHVEFDDAQFGRRVGYVQKSLVRVEGGR